MNKKLISALSIFSLCVVVTGCSTKNQEQKTNTSNNKTQEQNLTIGEIDTYIKLGKNITVDGSGATINNNKVTITSAGTYSISGTIDDGQVIVDAGAEDNVDLVLDNASITCSNSSPIYVKNAKNAVIALADGTENFIKDGDSYVLEDTSTDEPNAAIFSKDDLTFIGAGSLNVSANYNNGITSKDDLKFENGNISVVAVADGLRGKDSVTVTGGNINIDAKEDGIKSSNTEDSTKGYVSIQGGSLNIVSGQDGIQAETKASITDGSITISSGGGNENGVNHTNNLPGQVNQASSDTTESVSSKAIKASVDITINGGDINIDSADDAIHSNDSLVIGGGTINITSGDDGIHSDSTLEINDGEINIKKSYEGIESEVITLNGGNIHVTSSDDGINAAGGNDGSSMNGRPGQNKFASSGNGAININGGNIVVDSSGDGIDANGNISMTNGVVFVNGPTNAGNGALDYDGTFDVNGGLLVATGSLGMAQSPSSNSSQNSVNITLSPQEANTILNIKSSDGKDILTYAPSKAYQSVVVCSPDLKTGSTYTVSTGGSSTVEPKDGLYTGGTYSGGTDVVNFTISNNLTNATQDGVSAQNNGGPGGNKGGPMGGKPMDGQPMPEPGVKP